MLTADELRERGLEASNAGRHAKARGLLTRALQRSDDGVVTARVLTSLAHVESELGDRESGLALCDRALAIKGLPADVVGTIHSQRGLVLMRAGMGDDAMREFERALALLGDDPEARMRVHLNRGNVFLQRGDAQRAVSDFAKAADYARAADLPIQQAKAEHNVGFASLLAGDLVAALQTMDRAKPALSSLSLVYEAVCEQDRAEVLAASGMVSEAEEALRAAAAAFGARGLHQQQAEAEFTLARLLQLDNPAEAAKVARRAHRRFQRRGSLGWSLRAEAVALGASLQADARGGRVLADADRVVASLTDSGLRGEAATLRLHTAGAEARRGDLAGARARVRPMPASAPLATRLLDREVRATIARRAGRRADAVAHVRRGLADLHEWQSSFGSLDLQSSLVGHGRALALQGLSLAVEDGRPAVVFEWAERARALASRVQTLRPPADPETAAELSELRQLQAEVREAEERGVVPKALIAHANRLRERIRQRAWYGAGSGQVTEPASLDAAVAGLGGGGALLSYLVVDGRLHCLVVTAGHPQLVALGSFAAVRGFLDGLQADLDMAAARMPAAMARAVRGSLGHRLGLLDAALVGPVRDRIGDGPLVVVPSGALGGVPWTLLPGLAGRPLTVPRSATSWLDDLHQPFGLTSAGFVAGPRVERAAEEVALASRAWARAETLGADDAAAQPVRDLASRVDVFHAAAHGRHSADNPLFSGLELADGPWFGYDIDLLEDIPETVVLSACEVGRSSVRWGEETIGMTVAWLHAGARCVIASPALVNDDAACEVLAATHARLARGESPSDALAAATDDVRPEAPAPFLAFGNGWS